MHDSLLGTDAAMTHATGIAFDSYVVRILSLIGDGVVIVDQGGSIILLNRAAEAMFGYSSDELSGFPIEVLIPERFHERHRADVSGFAGPMSIEHRAMGFGREVFGRHHNGSEFSIEATLSRDIFNGEQTFTAVVRDVTARNNAEQERIFLANEVAHRLRNTMAVVASITTLTARQATSVDGFRDALLGRLESISRTNDELIRGASADAGLSAIITAELAPYRHRAGNLALAGPEVRILGKQVLDLALLLHELATNAVKYGALSISTGKITIQWQLSNSVKPVLDLVWQEADGPVVVPPIRRGFGSRLIANCLRGHHGVVDLTFPVGGARCEVTLPLS